MSVSTPPASASSQGKRSALTGAALSDEVFDSSPSLLRPSRGDKSTVAGLQQFFSPPEAAELIAAVNGREHSTLDLTAGDGSLLAEVEPDFRFGIEIDADQVKAGAYEAIQGDVQRAYPLLRLLRTQFPRVACNPPFGLDWQMNGRKENSMVAIWRMANALLAERGAGAFIAGRDRFARDVLSRPDAAGVYALIECKDLFEGVELPCAIVFFVLAGNARQPREGGPLCLKASREELPGLAEKIRDERLEVAGYIPEPFRCGYRTALTETFKTVSKELARRREEVAAKRQRYDLELKGNRVSARPSPFARLALGQRRGLREVERLNGQPTTYFALIPAQLQGEIADGHSLGVLGEKEGEDEDLRGAVVLGGCASAAPSGAIVNTAVRLFAPRAFKPIPAKLWVGGGSPESVDARIWPDAVWLLETYDLRVTAARESGHETHGDGTAMDMVPAPGRGWDETALRAALDLGWISSCGASGSAPVCPLVAAIQFIGYNGYPGHGDPSHAGENAHLHVSWKSSDYGCPGLCAPREWVEVFPWLE